MKTFMAMDKQIFWDKCLGKDGQTQDIVVHNFNCVDP